MYEPIRFDIIKQFMESIQQFLDPYKMTASPYNTTNYTFDNDTDPLDHRQTIQLSCEDAPTLNSSESAKPDFNQLFNFIAYGVLLNIIGVCGIIGNIVSVIILSRPHMKVSINYLLMGLVGYDTVLLITAILLFGLPSIYQSTGYLVVYNRKIHPIIAPVIYPMTMMSETGSIYLTIIVSIERYVAVCLPLRARSLCTCGHARLYMIGVLIFSILFNIIRFWEMNIEQCIYEDQMLGYRLVPSNLRGNVVYIQVYIKWMYLVFRYGLPFIALIWLNSHIYMQVRRANKERYKLSAHQRKEIGTAKMSLIIAIVFLLCYILSDALINFFASLNLENDVIDALLETDNLLVTINSSVTFVIYFTCGEKFRNTFFKLFCPRLFSDQNRNRIAGC